MSPAAGVAYGSLCRDPWGSVASDGDGSSDCGSDVWIVHGDASK